MESSEIMVSVCCLAYNHESYIKRCLDGFVMQKTNFKYEVLVHDDASTDKTADIIREYETKYPDIIKPIYQVENQYSKGIKISRVFQYPRANGKYLAICEGDDYWVDELKLQKQFDLLENHPEYSICVHQVVRHNCKTGLDTPYINQFENKVYSLEEIVVAKNCFFATCSVMIRKDVLQSMPKCFLAKGFGDYQMFIYAAIMGGFYYMSDSMSVYNCETPNSWSFKHTNIYKFRIQHLNEVIKMLKRVNEYYNFQYNEIFTQAIKNAEYDLCVYNGNFLKIHAPIYQDNYQEDINRGMNPLKRYFSNRFPRLYYSYFKVKERLLNGKKE